MKKIISTIKQNKLLVAIILLTLVAGIYIGMLAWHSDPAGDANATNGSVPGQQIIITDGTGFSVNGDVIVQEGGVTTIEQGTETEVEVDTPKNDSGPRLT